MNAVITLNQNQPAKIDIDQEGSKRSIYLDMQDLVNLIVSSVKDEHIDIEPKARPITISPSLPPNTVKYAKMSDDTEMIFLFHPETKANVMYHGSIFQDVPFPNLVFCFGVRNESIIKKHVLTYQERFLRDDTPLFEFPFSNVYTGGNMCYWSNEKVKDLVQLQTFPTRWLSEPFNDHLYQQGKTNLRDQSLREILDTTQGKPFDYDMLRSANRTFQDWAISLIK